MSLKRRSLIRPLFDKTDPDVVSEAAGCVRILARGVSVREARTVHRLLVGFATGGKRSAVARNRVKRLLRQAFRHQRAELERNLPAAIEKLTIMIVFREHDHPNAATVAADMKRAIARLTKTLEIRYAALS